ncbi:PadR family transcriptional regulator [Roseicella aerolata]|uniref:PadR family transcriptional regulator n=1 Tax=Roseicella aerolata TaxID=2883479 RepID=A0A9X1L639_9PROT|nr:PadR family transcriptional regulator [Roseicella aerolata]MCB4820149.1 PadR family transcriptional regulator [Roseicella aerolata]
MPKAPAAPAAVPPRVDYASRDYWAGTIKMGLSKFFILRVLHDGPMHGYDLARSVERTTRGCCSPTEGTIYPVLREFEAGGFVTAADEVVQGRQRRVYALTDAGRAAFRVALDAWMEATAALQDTGRAFAAADRAREKRDADNACCR